MTSNILKSSFLFFVLVAALFIKLSDAVADESTETNLPFNTQKIELEYDCLSADASLNVLILPPTGGVNSADRSLFRSLCGRGYSIAILDYEQKSGLTKNLSIHDQLTREFLNHLNQFLSEQQKPTVLIGASLGGLYASTAFGLAKIDASESLEKENSLKPSSPTRSAINKLKSEKRKNWPNLDFIEGVVLTVAGGSLADVLAYSEQSGVVEQRELRLETGKYKSLEDYQLKLDNAIKLDPLKLARSDFADRVLMFNSRNDSVVPTFTQENLWQAWGEPKVEWFGTNHQLSIGRVYLFNVNRIDEFLSRF